MLYNYFEVIIVGCKCCCEHDHCHEHEKINYGLLVFKIIIGVIAIFLGHIFEDNGYVSLYISIGAYIVISYDIFIDAFKEFREGDIFNEYLLMIIATIGAFFIGEYHESVMVMLLFIVGELLQGKAIDKSRESIINLVGLNKAKAYLKKGNSVVEIDPKLLKIGDIVVLRKGDMLSIDGKVFKGTGYIDDSNLTGESLPKYVKKGSEVLSGVINVGDALEIEVLKEYENSKIHKILSLVEEANERKGESDKIIRKIAKVYTPLVIFLALLIVPISLLLKIGDLSSSIYSSLTFLLISCPCAIIISVPITYFAAVGGASRRGILVKGANFLDLLYKVKIIAFDKTGTLSEGKFVVKDKFVNVGVDEKDFIECLLLSQVRSNHPISRSILEYFKDYKTEEENIVSVSEIGGMGLVVKLDKSTIYAGNKKLMNKYNIQCSLDDNSTIVAVAKDNCFLGYVLLEDKIKESAYEGVKKLNHYYRVMLSGDSDEVCKKVSEELDFNEYHASLLPEEKMNYVKELSKRGQTMFVGDGVNDTLSISLADVSVAMGVRGSDASIEYSDIVIENDNLENISTAFKFAKKTRYIILQNLIVVMSLKLVFMILSLFGIVNMWIAIFSDVGLCILSILNSMRAMKVK